MNRNHKHHIVFRNYEEIIARIREDMSQRYRGRAYAMDLRERSFIFLSATQEENDKRGGHVP